MNDLTVMVQVDDMAPTKSGHVLNTKQVAVTCEDRNPDDFQGVRVSLFQEEL